MKSNTGKLNAPTLTAMRATIAPSIDLSRQLRKNEALRNDDALLAKAAAKRERKAGRKAEILAKRRTSTSEGNPN